MTLLSPVTFKPSQLGRETAHLGDKLIGQVAPLHERTHRAVALILLPDIARRQWPAPSLDAARERVRREVADWLDGAGLVPAQRRRA